MRAHGPASLRGAFHPAGKRIHQEASCPVAGEYEGVIPETGEQLCAKLYSDCNNPDIMFYTVISCENASDIYEGEWRQRHHFAITLLLT